MLRECSKRTGVHVVMLLARGSLLPVMAGAAGGYACGTLGPALCSKLSPRAALATEEWGARCARLTAGSPGTASVLLPVCLTGCGDVVRTALEQLEEQGQLFAVGRSLGFGNAVTPSAADAASAGIRLYQEQAAAARRAAPRARGVSSFKAVEALRAAAALAAAKQSGEEPGAVPVVTAPAAQQHSGRFWKCTMCGCRPGAPTRGCRCNCERCLGARGECCCDCPAARPCAAAACVCPIGCTCSCKHCNCKPSRAGTGAAAAAAARAAAPSGGAQQQQRRRQHQQRRRRRRGRFASVAGGGGAGGGGAGGSGVDSAAPGAAGPALGRSATSAAAAGGGDGGQRPCALPGCSGRVSRPLQAFCSNWCYAQRCSQTGKEPKRCKSGANCLAMAAGAPPGAAQPGWQGGASCELCWGQCKRRRP
jgi:hypothetical protein